MTLDDLEKKSAAANEINWITASFMIAFHVGAIAALFFFTWKGLFILLFLNWVSGSLGIGMGYHRLLTHRGYKTPKWVEYFLTVCATLALEGGPIFWVATHRIHHQYSDKEGDPHSPIDGKWWAHMGWILMGKSMHHDTTTLARYVPDLAKDKFHVWITKYHYVPMIVLGVILLAIGGFPSRALGHFPSHRHRSAFDLAGEFGHAFMGHAAVPDPRPFDEQLVGSDACRSAKAGTTITTRIRRRRGTASPGTRSTSTGTASGRSRSSASRRISSASSCPKEARTPDERSLRRRQESLSARCSKLGRPILVSALSAASVVGAEARHPERLLQR